MRSRLSPWLKSSQRSLRRISAKTAGQVCTVPAVGDDAFVLPAKSVQLSCDKALMFQCCLTVHPAISRGSFAHVHMLHTQVKHCAALDRLAEFILFVVRFSRNVKSKASSLDVSTQNGTP